jgi:chromosome segregation ATPase
LYITELQKRVVEVEAEIKKAEELSTEARNKIQRSLHLVSQADLDIMKQKQVVNDLKSQCLALNARITQNTAEIEILKVKVQTVAGVLAMGGMAYRRQAETLQKQRSDLDREVNQQRERVKRASHRRGLFLEEIRIEKSLIRESGKCRALEDQLEKPMNVHRWLFLDGTNPELAQLLRMDHELRDRLVSKIAVLQRLNLVKDQMQGTVKDLDQHLTKGYCGEVRDEMNFLNTLLKQKTKQLAAIEGRVMDQDGSVVDQKEQIRTVRSLMRVERDEYFTAKKRADRIRGSTSLAKRTLDVVNHEARFIGGGFAVAGVVQQNLQEPLVRPGAGLQHRIEGGRRTAAIIQPLVQKNLPRGWTPQRGPLKPTLPTVSGAS